MEFKSIEISPSVLYTIIARRQDLIGFEPFDAETLVEFRVFQ